MKTTNIAVLEYWICCIWKRLYKRDFQWGICQSMNFVIHCECVNVVAWRDWLFQNPFSILFSQIFEQIWFCSLFEILRMLNSRPAILSYLWKENRHQLLHDLTIFHSSVYISIYDIFLGRFHIFTFYVLADIADISFLLSIYSFELLVLNINILFAILHCRLSSFFSTVSLLSSGQSLRGSVLCSHPERV